MDDKLQFLDKLQGLVAKGNEKEKILSLHDVQQYFQEAHLTEEQMELVCDYLLAQKIAVTGYVKQGVHVEEGISLSSEDEKYLSIYLEEIASLRPQNEREAKLKYYFPKVVDIAKELYEEGYMLEDLIQEGNVGLMMALEMEGSTEEEILAQVRQTIQMLQEEQEEENRKDKKMIEKVIRLDECVTALKEELERKPTLEELAAFMELTEEEVNDILRLTGEEEDDEVDGDDEDEEDEEL